MRVLAALAGGCTIALALFGAFTAAFLYGIGPVEYLIDRDTTFGF